MEDQQQADMRNSNRALMMESLTKLVKTWGQVPGLDATKALQKLVEVIGDSLIAFSTSDLAAMKWKDFATAKELATACASPNLTLTSRWSAISLRLQTLGSEWFTQSIPWEDILEPIKSSQLWLSELPSEAIQVSPSPSLLCTETISTLSSGSSSKRKREQSSDYTDTSDEESGANGNSQKRSRSPDSKPCGTIWRRAQDGMPHKSSKCYCLWPQGLFMCDYCYVDFGHGVFQDHECDACGEIAHNVHCLDCNFCRPCCYCEYDACAKCNHFANEPKCDGCRCCARCCDCLSKFISLVHDLGDMTDDINKL